ncbi:MAG TPA: hypothetical protein ENN11_01505 [Methanomicrobia archaeon]|nr:hypothetical protein [Methanomicrobia archaeon]
MRKIISIFMAIVIISSLSAGCISSDGDDNGTTTQPPTTTHAPTTTQPPTTTQAPTTTQPPTTTQAPTTTTPGNGESWELYDFEVGQSFTYDVSWSSEDMSESGTIHIDILPSSAADYEVHYYGSTDSMNISFDTRFNTNRGSFYNDFVNNLYSGYTVLAPMFTFTILGGWWNAYFAGRTFYVGNSWSITVDGETATFEIQDTCSHAGIEGYYGLWTHTAQDTRLGTCVSPDVPLVLASEFRTGSGDSEVVYTAELVEYSS